MKVVRPNHVSKTFYIRLVFKKNVVMHFVEIKIIITIILYTITILLFALTDTAVVTLYNIL